MKVKNAVSGGGPVIRYMSGDTVIDDYREAYWWVRDNTPKDARVLSWWDYGYQISGIAQRTTLADGNTWNIVTRLGETCLRRRFIPR